MPRKERIEFSGAKYHIISRGNYRKDLFRDTKTANAFEKALFEVVLRCGWKLYAYVIMSNHYHLAIETPEPNLVYGMQWLQSTFATRFNRFRKENGHVFQGRYKSLLITEEKPLLGLVNYIHLNPVRAKICSLDNLKDYKHSSFSNYFKKTVPSVLSREQLLSLNDLEDSAENMDVYHKSLYSLIDEDYLEDQKKAFSRGWFIGSKEAKVELAKEISEQNDGVQWNGPDSRTLNEIHWERIVLEEMLAFNKDESDLINDKKGADWKVRIAQKLRKETTASNPWIANRLNMGHPNYVSNLINLNKS